MLSNLNLPIYLVRNQLIEGPTRTICQFDKSALTKATLFLNSDIIQHPTDENLNRIILQFVLHFII